MTKYVILLELKDSEVLPHGIPAGTVAVWAQLPDLVEAAGAEQAAKVAAKGDEGSFSAVPEGSFPIFDLEVEKTERTKVTRRTAQRKRPRRAAASAGEGGS